MNGGGSEQVDIVVEAKSGSRHKYSSEEGGLKLERILPDSIVFPEDYGRLDKTMHESGAPLEGFVLTEEPFEPGSYVSINPIGAIRTRNGDLEKDIIIGVPVEENTGKDRTDIKDLEEELLIQLKVFIGELHKEKSRFEVRDTIGSDKTKRLINRCKKIYKRRGM